jgi:hypothetical protein
METDMKQIASFPPKRRMTFKGIHDIISQKTELFNTSTVSASRVAVLWVETPCCLASRYQRLEEHVEFIFGVEICRPWD